MPPKPRVCIVTPGTAEANNGNWHTAARWQRLLAPCAAVTVAQTWHGEPADVLIALHALRSAESIRRFRAARTTRPLIVVLTGTDLYRDFDRDAGARDGLGSATHLVVLQEEALARLTPAERGRTTVIEQSTTHYARRAPARRTFDFVCVGHLRAAKDPLTLMRAARVLPERMAGGLAPRVLHIGRALRPGFAAAAEHTMAECRAYRWLGPRSPTAARRAIARARALVQPSLMEGGALAVIEALCSDVPVIASRIDGNVGLLGRDYGGYFPVGDAAALACLMQRFADEPAFAARLAAQCCARAPRFAPAVEAMRLRALLAAALGTQDAFDRPASGAQPGG